MRRPVRIGTEAQAELAETSRWYDQQLPGLGLEFLQSIRRAISRIEASQHIGVPVPGIADPDVRRVLVRRFPYHVVYVELPNHAQVLAIAHHRRRPRYWIGRVPR